MGGRVVLPPDPALSAASPPCRSRLAAAAPSAPRASSPPFLSACRGGFASGSLPPSVGCSAAQRVRRPFRPRPGAPVASSPPAPPPLPPPDTAARAASAATLATRSTSRARGRSMSITSRTMAPTSGLGAPRRVRRSFAARRNRS
eukprot:6175035-Pleurochrysis_carterae.AAC.2